MSDVRGVGCRRHGETIAPVLSLIHAITSEAVLSAVAAAAGLAVGELPRRRRGAPLKANAASLLVRHAGSTQREVARLPPVLVLTLDYANSVT